MNPEIRKERPSLEGARVFLSASFPKEERDERYKQTVHPLQLTDAVKAIVRAVLSREGCLVFGGHPSITPLVLEVGKDVLPNPDSPGRGPASESTSPAILLFQSKAFEGQIPKATQELAEVPWVKLEEVPGSMEDLDDSLEKMRNRMILETDPQAAVFIGGMEGVEEEWRMFREKFPTRPAFPIGSSGGAAKLILENPGFDETVTVDSLLERHYSGLLRDLEESTSYAYLANRLVDAIARFSDWR